MTDTDEDHPARAGRIAALNDQFRRTGRGGQVFITRGVDALGMRFVQQALAAVRDFTAFTPDNDPHGEHDFGALEVAGRRLFFKIDCYDPSLMYGSEDPADPKVTARVLTIMLAEEY